MPAPRHFATISTADQWLRCGHTSTALLNGIVQLPWITDECDPFDTLPTTGVSSIGAGLAFDQHCRLFHSVANGLEKRVERILWSVSDPLRPAVQQPAPSNLFEVPEPELHGDFVATAGRRLSPIEPRGLAVDKDDRLFIADRAGRCICVFDLPTRRMLRRVRCEGRPLDLVADGRTIYASLESPAGILRFSRSAEPQSIAVPLSVSPSRLAVSPCGVLHVLDTAHGEIHRLDHDGPVFTVPQATDIEFCQGMAVAGRGCPEATVLVVARSPSQDFLMYCLDDDHSASSTTPMPLTARGYDGQGIVRCPDGRIGFWTAFGFRHAVAPRLRYKNAGHVLTFRLDCGEYHTQWGRLFLDACVPRETEVNAFCVTTDDPPDGETWPRSRPENFTNASLEELNEASPPMPPFELLPIGFEQDSPEWKSLYRRETGSEQVWIQSADGGFETYEMPIHCQPGRFLWIALRLTGNGRTTPRIRAARAEFPCHDYLNRIPQTFSREPAAADFLTRYLALFEGFLGDLEAKADARHALLDPRSAPSEILPWLAGFVGLVLDERLRESQRRRLIAEAVWLFRFRGTVPGLQRFLDICAETRVVLIERFRLRGTGVGTVGGTASLSSTSVVGMGFRVGGGIGKSDTVQIGGTTEDAFATHAHRFSVLIAGRCDPEQLNMIRHILDVHRPAHTLVDVCTAADGSRVGTGLHLGLTSVIGPGGGFELLQIGASQLGRDTLVGQPTAGTVAAASRLGKDSRVG